MIGFALQFALCLVIVGVPAGLLVGCLFGWYTAIFRETKVGTDATVFNQHFHGRPDA